MVPRPSALSLQSLAPDHRHSAHASATLTVHAPRCDCELCTALMLDLTHSLGVDTSAGGPHLRDPRTARHHPASGQAAAATSTGDALTQPAGPPSPRTLIAGNAGLIPASATGAHSPPATATDSIINQSAAPVLPGSRSESRSERQDPAVSHGGRGSRVSPAGDGVGAALGGQAGRLVSEMVDSGRASMIRIGSQITAASSRYIDRSIDLLSIHPSIHPSIYLSIYGLRVRRRLAGAVPPSAAHVCEGVAVYVVYASHIMITRACSWCTRRVARGTRGTRACVGS